MGAYQGKEKSRQKQNQAQYQVVEQNYANNIMLMAFSTLESICRKVLGKDSQSLKKKYGKQDKVDYSTKTMAELVSQFKTHLFLLRVSKESMQAQFKNQNGFVFSKDFPKQDVLREIAMFRSICELTSEKNLLSFCDDFYQIIQGNYNNLNFERANVKVEYTQKEKQKQKTNLLKDGINATVMMDELREEVQKGGVNNPSDLKVTFNKPDVQYEKYASAKTSLRKQ